MKLDSRHRNLFFSVLLFVLLIGAVFLISWDSDFAAAGIFFITDLIALVLGITFIFLKVAKMTIQKTSFIYCYFGVLNSIIAIFYLTRLIMDVFSVGVLLLTLVHFFIGLYILLDIFRKPE